MNVLGLESPKQVILIKGRPAIDRNALVEAADELDMLAIELGEQNIEATVAIDSLLRAAMGNIAAVRRAHRHSQHRLSELWPAEAPLLRSFFYLSAVRRQMEVKDRASGA